MALILGMLVGAPLHAARLCRDTKGLFTPCPETLNKTAQRSLKAKIAEPPARHATAAPGETASEIEPAAHPEPAAKPARPAHVIVHSKLCRDTKGLFTPCPR